MKFKVGDVISPKKNYYGNFSLWKKRFYGIIKESNESNYPQYTYTIDWSDETDSKAHTKGWVEDNFQLQKNPNDIMKDIL